MPTNEILGFICHLPGRVESTLLGVYSLVLMHPPEKLVPVSRRPQLTLQDQVSRILILRIIRALLASLKEDTGSAMVYEAPALCGWHLSFSSILVFRTSSGLTSLAVMPERGEPKILHPNIIRVGYISAMSRHLC